MHSASKPRGSLHPGVYQSHKGESSKQVLGGGSFGSGNSTQSVQKPQRVNATARMKMLLQNENLAQLTEEVEELKDINVDELIVNEEKKLYENKLKELRLCEKIGINGEVMLYPKKEKEKKWYNGEYESMVNQLYQVKYVDQFSNLAAEVREELESGKLCRIADIREREKKLKHEHALYWKKMQEKLNSEQLRHKSLAKGRVGISNLGGEGETMDSGNVRRPKLSPSLQFKK